MLTETEKQNAVALIDLALREDLGDAGDITSNAFIPEEAKAEAFFIARRDGVLAGLPVAALVCERFKLQFEPLKSDGDAVRKGDKLARLTGPARAMLAAERTALNFLQRLSGVATKTRSYVDAVAGTRAKILDTRKTTPGWRYLEKYAVRMGGGVNHRIGLFDAVLIKDNHIAALKLPHPQGVVASVERARHSVGPAFPIIVEVDDLEGFRAVLPLKPAVVLLDNMPPAEMRKAVLERDSAASPTLLEASGGITMDTLRTVAETGVDRISVGALTHSAVALDIALDFVD